MNIGKTGRPVPGETSDDKGDLGSAPKLVTVCGSCFRACCWYGEFMCQDARNATLVAMTTDDLRALDLEHPDYWAKPKLLSVYGTSTPNVTERRVSLADARTTINEKQS